MTREVLATVAAALAAAFLYALSNVYQQGEAEQIEDEQTMRLRLLARLAERARVVARRRRFCFGGVPARHRQPDPRRADARDVAAVLTAPQPDRAAPHDRPL